MFVIILPFRGKYINRIDNSTIFDAIVLDFLL